MMLYEPDRKSDSLSLSTRSTATSMSTMPRYVLYDPEEPAASTYPANPHRPHKSASRGIGRHLAHHIEVRENGAVVTHTHNSLLGATTAAPRPLTSPYNYFGKQSLLEDPYDAYGIRQGAWETGICDPRAWLPMTCGVPFAVPSVALAQMRTRLGLAHYYGMALVKEFCRLLALGTLPIAAAVALRKLQALPPNAAAEDQMEATAWMVLLWSACLAVIILLLVTALALSELRFKIRARFQIPGTRSRDLCLVACLPTCAVAQMSTHVRCLRPGRYSLARPETLPPYEY